MSNVPERCKNCILLAESKTKVGVEFFCKLYGFDFKDNCNYIFREARKR